MKKTLLTLAFAISIIFAGSIAITSCGDAKHSKNDEHEHVEGEQHENMEMSEGNEKQSGNDEAHVYACPMHPEITGKEDDKCSKCGMKLTMVEHEH